jgi:enoyl-CoA hydratase/carnithine racemase
MEAAEAHAIGLIHYLVPHPEDLMPKAVELAEQLTSKPQIAMRLTKRRFNEMSQTAYEDALRAGGPIQAEAYATGEPQATMRLFFEERARRRAARGRG